MGVCEEQGRGGGWGGGSRVGVLGTITPIHTCVANPFILTSLPSLPLRVRQLIAVKTCLIESFQANPQAWAFVGPVLVNIH